MKIRVDGLADGKGAYDKRGLVRSVSGKHYYPSKKMFVDFLNKYKDVKADVDIWAVDNITDGTTTINVELKFKVHNLPKGVSHGK